MNLFSASEIWLNYNQHKILENLNFGIDIGQKIALVGINGSGKTSLLKIIAGIIEADEGEIQINKETHIEYLPQDFPIPDDITVNQFLFADQKTEKIVQETSRLLNLFEIMDLERPLQSLSGGEQRKVFLARAIAKQADILLLDEPTNHLDLEALEILKRELNSYQGTFILICHDRYFIDQVAKEIWEIDNRKLFKHSGNYSQYLQTKEKRYTKELTEHNRRKQWLKRELEWVRSGVKARGTKDQGRLKRYYEVKEYHQEHKPKFSKPYLPIPKALPLGNKILLTQELNLQSPQKKLLIKDLDLEFEEGFKLGILGPNGSGKTTLIKSLLGKYPKLSGKIILGQNTHFNYQDQKRFELLEDKSIIYNLSEGNIKMKFGDTTTNVYAYLKKFLFSPNDLDKPVSSLSGGQRARLLLAKLLRLGGNFLILDEPTNDLDLDTLQALENSLKEFAGCCLIVSHDRFFLDQVCTHMLTLEGDGKWVFSHGGYSRYLQKYGRNSTYYAKFVDKDLEQSHTWQDLDKQSAKNTPVKEASDPFKKVKKNPKREARIQRAKLREIEKKMQAQQELITDLEKELKAPDFYANQVNYIQKKLDQYQTQKDLLEKLELEWLEYSENLG